MKHFGKLAVLGAALVAAPFASAVPITLGSYGTAGLTTDTVPVVTNGITTYVGYENYATVAAIPVSPGPVVGQPGTGFTATGTPSVDLNPETPIWNAALANSNWVGINANAGPQNTSNPAFGYYEFQTSFVGLAGYAGSINVYADDTTEVYLTNANGTSLIMPFGVIGSDQQCADGKPSCVLEGTAAISDAAGVNVLTFIVEQAGLGGPGGQNDPSGLDFDATLTPTPEPSSLMLLGSGLVSAAGLLVRRRRIA